VLTAIELNNETRFETGKISDVFSNRQLASEFDPIESAVTQLVPKLILCFRHFATKRTGKATFGLGNGLMRHSARLTGRRTPSNTPHPSRRYAPSHLLPQGEKAKPRAYCVSTVSDGRWL